MRPLMSVLFEIAVKYAPNFSGNRVRLKEQGFIVKIDLEKRKLIYGAFTL